MFSRAASAYLLGSILYGMAFSSHGQVDDAFFEARIRPVLIEDCLECHSSKTKTKGGLALDTREGLLEGGDSGAAANFDQAEKSLLLQLIRHEDSDREMPKNRPKLGKAVVDDFAQWIAAGAPWPDTAPLADASLSWEETFVKRKDWWAFHPIAPQSIPLPNFQGNPVDYFLAQQWETKSLAVSPPANPRDQLKRLSFVLTGLPPTLEEFARFGNLTSAENWIDAVDHYLASPGFGVNWGRHWMDWVRYAESHGSEGDPAIPHAWRYRDYLVRALNDDVPCDQLIREHIAGDLLPEPRLSQDGTFRESSLGTAHLRMVQHGFTPTDALDEFVTFTDNQIDVVTKAFLGLTVSCARCHDHKFDAISQEDYFALFGIFAGNKPALIDVAAAPKPGAVESARQAKERLRKEIAGLWKARIDEIVARLRDWKPEDKEREASRFFGHPLSGMVAAMEGDLAAMPERWTKLAYEWRQAVAENEKSLSESAFVWKPGQEVFWMGDGRGVDWKGSVAGDFLSPTEGDKMIEVILPPGLFSDSVGGFGRAVAFSHSFPAETGKIHIRVSGGGGSRLRYVVQNYPRNGTVYPQENLNDGLMRWKSWDIGYWKGDLLHWEVTTAADAPVGADDPAKSSWFHISEVRHGGEAPRETGAPVFGLVPEDRVPSGKEEVLQVYQAALLSAFDSFSRGAISENEALFLQEFLGRGWLPNDRRTTPLASLDEWRKSLADLPKPIRAPGVLEAQGVDQALYERGNHRKPAQVVPRRFLSALDTIACSEGSGRLSLAAALTAPNNPMTARVMVNRLWHHVFGRGLVATTDNFGRMGDLPTHPELLDHLAHRFMEEEWSIKRLIRLLVTSDAFRRSSVPLEGSLEKDPDARWLSRFPLRRLTAENIRDSLLATSGLLDGAEGGPPAPANSFRRSLYLPVIRNNLHPFLTVFDAPAPFTARGVRDSTNVPAQSLTMLNDPFVEECAQKLARRVMEKEQDSSRMISVLYQSILGRDPGPDEIKDSLAWVNGLKVIDPSLAEKEELLRKEWEITSAEVEKWRASLPSTPQKPTGPTAEPVFAWDFSKGNIEAIGDVPGKLMGRAEIKEGALVTGENAWFQTEPLPLGFSEKTLEAWVQLGNLEQQGGGVVSVESLDAQRFDALVYGERKPGEWMAGSDFFKRTKDFDGKAESLAHQQVIHLALVYGRDGRVSLYRNGKLYGNSFTAEGPLSWAKGESRILIGLRHGAPEGNRLLNGRIFRVNFYPKALSQAEIQASLAARPVPLEELAWVEGLGGEDKTRISALLEKRDRLEREWKKVKVDSQVIGDAEAWTRLAHALYNTKEFLYLP